MEIEQINIHSLPFFFIPERDKLPEFGGIYFVLSASNDIEYIGKARNLNKRWRKHECCIDLDSPKTCRVAWIEVSNEEKRAEYEKKLIGKFNPKLNANFIIKPPPVFNITNTNVNLISTKEVAERLKISKVRVFQLIKDGSLLAEKIGRDWFVKESDFVIFSENRREAGRPPKVKEEK